MNVARYLLPHVLTLSTSSPFWMGRQHRAQVLPQRRLPELPAHRHAAHHAFVERVFVDGRGDGEHQLHPRRVEDLVGRAAAAGATRRSSSASATSAPASTKRSASRAIFQAIIAKLWKLRRDNLTFRQYAPALIEENKWRAVRYGLDGKLIDFGQGSGAPGPGPDPRADGVVHRRRGRRAGHRGTKWSMRTRSWRRARAPTGSCARSSRPATSTPSWTS